jgi:hypothetical protein
VAYRDDRDALHLQLDALEGENGRLKKDLDELQERYDELVQRGHEIRRSQSRASCTMCGGSLLPVALFAGRDSRRPVPLQISTLRYGSPEGGFTHTGALHSLACSSCGYLHNFLAFNQAGQLPDDEELE